MSGHYPLTLQIFPLTLKHNAMKYKAAPVKDQYDFFFHINTVHCALFWIFFGPQWLPVAAIFRIVIKQCDLSTKSSKTPALTADFEDRCYCRHLTVSGCCSGVFTVKLHKSWALELLRAVFSPHCSSPCTRMTAHLKTPPSSSWSLQTTPHLSASFRTVMGLPTDLRSRSWLSGAVLTT